MDAAKWDPSIDVGQGVGYWDMFDIEAEPLFYHTIEKDSQMNDIEASGDASIRFQVHVSTLQVIGESDELTDLKHENARLRTALGEPVGVLSDYAQKAYIESLPNDIDSTLDFKQSYFEKLIASDQAKLAEARLILKSVVAEKAKRRAAQFSPLPVDTTAIANRGPLSVEERAHLKEFELSKVYRQLEEAYVYGDRMKNETVRLRGALQPFSEAFQDWLERPEIESNADFGDWIRQYLKKKSKDMSIRRWFERAADVLTEE